MTAVEYLTSHGIKPSLKNNGKIGLVGLAGIPEKTRREVLTWAKDHRAEIVAELKNTGQKGHKGHKGHCPARCRATGLCYHRAYFEGKPGRGLPCDPGRCPKGGD